MEKNWIRYMGLQAQESAREGGDQEGKMRRDRPNEVGNTARQSLPASGGEGTQRVPNKVTTYKISFIDSFPKRLEQTREQNKNISSKNVPGKFKKREEPWVESSPVRSRRLRQGTSRRVPCQEGWCHHHYDYCHHQQDPCQEGWSSLSL